MADDSSEAFKNAGLAMYKSSDIDERIKEIEQRYVSEAVRRNGGAVVFVADLMINRRVRFKWTF